MLWSKSGEPWFDSSKKILFIYLLLSLTWILVSDRLVAMYITDSKLNLAAQTYKGWFYVLVVGVFIYLEKVMSARRVRESEKRYEDVIKNTNAAYFRMDKEARIVEVNEAWLKMYKYDSMEEVKGMSFEKFQVPEFVEGAKKLVARLLNGETLSGDFARLNKDGSTGYFTYSASPVYRNGEIVGFEAFMVDVTDQKRVEEMLKEREKKFHALFENMVEGVAIHEIEFDKKGNAINYKILDINEAYEKNTGLKATEVKGKLSTDIYGTKEPPYFKQYVNVTKTGKPYTFDVHFEPLKRYFHISAFALDKSHFVTVFQDITERKSFETEIINLNNRTNAEKRKFETVVKEMADAVVVIDREKKIMMTNKALEKLSGFSESELIGKNYEGMLKFVYEKNDEVLSDIPAPIFESGVTKRPKEDVCLIRKDGKKIGVDGVASPIKDETGEVIGAVGIMRDVTRQRELDRLRTDFVSMASHQLRTPLTGIKWFVELLLEQRDKLSKPEMEKFLRSISESNERMIALVNDLLNVSRIDSGRLKDGELKTKSLKEILLLTLADQDKVIRDMGSKIVGVDKIEENIYLKGDESHYLQIFGNLINNAVKYSPRNSEVKVDVEKGRENVTVIISDSGMGIPSNHLKRIFEKFYRAENVAKNIPGSGLGLYVVKSLVENYGGKIKIESKEGVGTKVYVQLPFIINNDG